MAFEERKEISGQNGAKIVINAADFEDAADLKDLIESKASEAGIKIESFNLADMDMGFIVQALLKIDGSKAFRNQLFLCLKRSLYNGEKISKDTFEPIANRADYYPILIECVKLNLLPFFHPLISMWKKYTVENLQKSESLEQK